MKKWGKKEIMKHLYSFISEAFECDHISVTFPNDNMVKIELTNRSDAERKEEQEMIEADADPLG